MSNKEVFFTDKYRDDMKKVWKGYSTCSVISLLTAFIISFILSGHRSITVLGIIWAFGITLYTLISYGFWVESFALKVPFIITEEGFMSPIRTYKQYRKGETTFIKFNEISEIIIREGPEMRGWDSMVIKRNNDSKEYYLIKFLIEDGYDLIKKEFQEKIPTKWNNRKIEKFQSD